MEIYTTNIQDAALENNFFRKVLKTGEHSQLVLMSLNEGEEIGEEVHHVDQVLVFVEGVGKAVLDDKEYDITPESVFFVPAGTKHNFINSHDGKMKLYTVYAPAEHPDGTIHKTKAEADAAEAEEHAS